MEDDARRAGGTFSLGQPADSLLYLPDFLFDKVFFYDIFV